MYLGTLPEQIVSKFSCMVCFGIVIKPIRCLSCDTLVCHKCTPEDKLAQKKFDCVLKCYENQNERRYSCNEEPVVPRYGSLSVIEKQIYDTMKFSC